jgi:hypothetical protein
MWRPPLAETVDGRNGYEWNVTIPVVEGFGNLAIRTISDGIIVASQINQDTYPYTLHERAYDAKTGAQLWAKDRTTPHERPTYGPSTDGVYTLFIRDSVTIRGFDIKTGNQLWETDPMDENDWEMYGGPMTAAYGKLYAGNYGGRVYCFDMITGTKEFTYYGGSAGLETPYGFYPFRYDLVLADGKFFGTNSEHSPTSPLYRGEGMHAVDANTGERVWFIKGWWDNPAIADGYLVVHNAYDNRIYSFGKGETKTTVSVQNDVIGIGDSVLIKGMVTDESAGAKQTEQVARFPNGVPAIGDEYMTEWMEHLYMQQGCPMMINGVEVKLETLDPNNNFYEIGTVTSDAAGMFKILWEPPVPGEYTIMATFDGSESYWRSYAETAIGVEEAPSPGGPIEPEPTEAPFITTEMAIIIAVVAVAIISIVAFWTLRKRK